MKKKIIDRNKHLRKADIGDQFRLWSNRKTLVEKPILNQSRRDKTVIYGCYAVNKLVNKHDKRDTYDFDVYSRTPRRHALEIEKSIDQGLGANVAYVEKTRYIEGKKVKPLFRVKTHINDNVEADFNTMPGGVQYKTKKGVRFESLKHAEQKYNRMIDNPDMGRGFNAHIDLDRVRRSRKHRRW